MRLASFAGMAKPMPTEPPVGETIAVSTPTTSPSMLNIGPPELPGLIGASIWMKSSNGPEPISRPRAEMMPAVTDPPSPNGLPAATIQSPTSTSRLSPQVTLGSGAAGLTLITAMSVSSSQPDHLGRQFGAVDQRHDDLVGVARPHGCW